MLGGGLELGKRQVKVEVEQQGVQVARGEQILNLEVVGVQEVVK